jgi:phosphoethanolamine N-methyltransferase
MGLEPESRVLDAGCGLGGSAFVMASQFGLAVDGIDLSENMLSMARQKHAAKNLENRVTLEHGDCLELDRPGYYDAIYSRDVFLHISDKTSLFQVLRKSLRRGGKLFFTDYCCGEKPWSREFSDYVSSRGYDLKTVPQYAAILRTCGFTGVTGEDITRRFIEILNDDIARIAELEITQQSRLKLQAGWKQKLHRAESGDHRWGLFQAENPG